MGKALRHGFQTVFRAVVLTLPVQQRFVCPFLRHIQSVAEAFRKIHHPAHIVRPVIQRNVGNGGAVRFGLRQLQGRPGAAAGEQAQRQRRRWDTLVHKNLPI